MKRLAITLVALVCWLMPQFAAAQGMLIVIAPEPHPLPRPIIRPIPTPPPMSYKIKEIAMQARVIDQVAQVQVSQSFVNTGSQQMEVSFVFPLPYEAAIDALTLLVDGKEFPGKLLDAKDARSKYEEIVRRNRDPALLEWMGTGMFQTSVFPVPPGAERKVTLRYNQICRKDRGLTELLFPLSTAKYTSHAVESLDFRVSIESTQEIKNVYSPSHAINIQRPDDKHAVITYNVKNQIPSSDFRLFYDAGAGQLGASVLSFRPSEGDEGYFLLLASPQIQAEGAARQSKTVVFVVDRSGSMSGEKIEQAKGALKFVLNNLREGDLFNIVAYDTEVQSFRPELEKFNDDTRKAALGFVEGIYAGGGTNIDGALKVALNQLKDGSRPNYVLFMTDGLPTVGEQNELKITAHAKEANQVRARIISFGVGYDVNSRLLDRISRDNFGQSEYVRPNENLEAQVSKLYQKMSAPVMSDVQVSFEFDAHFPKEMGEPVSRVYPKEIYDVFEGQQVVLVGRYKQSGPVKVVIKGKLAGAEKKFDFPATLSSRSGDDSYAFVEKLWAMRRIGEIIDQIDLSGKNDELVKELVALSTKHGILTPYTSFLADETTDVRRLADNFTRARGAVDQLAEKAEGKSGFAQRADKNRLLQAEQAGQPAYDSATGAGGAAGPAATTSAPAAPGAVVVHDAESDRTVIVENCRTYGNKTFFYRQKDQQWVDSTVTEEEEKNAIRVVQFSPEYFKLAAANGRKLAQYLAVDEPLIVSVDGQAYCIVPETSK